MAELSDRARRTAPWCSWCSWCFGCRGCRRCLGCHRRGGLLGRPAVANRSLATSTAAASKDQKTWQDCKQESSNPPSSFSWHVGPPEVGKLPRSLEGDHAPSNRFRQEEFAVAGGPIRRALRGRPRLSSRAEGNPTLGLETEGQGRHLRSSRICQQGPSVKSCCYIELSAKVSCEKLGSGRRRREGRRAVADCAAHV
jgi:hypothetical protein